MREFAKLFATDLGQVLVVIDSGDDGSPEISIRFKPEGLGVCALTVSNFSDDDTGHDAAELLFNGIDEKVARVFVVATLTDLGINQHKETDPHD
jgi:hypothetical protein